MNESSVTRDFPGTLRFHAAALEALDALECRGFSAYIVGGAVRDALLGEDAWDIDITTSARPEEIARVFSDRVVAETGRRFGTMTVMIDRLKLEITTFRTEAAYRDGRRPDEVRFSDSLEEDLARRDFTINAMAWNPREGLIDRYGGRRDLRARVLRAVGDADERIREDALRALRAVRFSARLGMEPEEPLLEALKKSGPLVSRLSAERVSQELGRFLADGDISRGMLLLRQTGLLETVLPELALARRGESESLCRRRDALIDRMREREEDMRWAALLRPLDAETAARCCRRLRLSNRLVAGVKRLVALPRGEKPDDGVLWRIFDDFSGDVEKPFAFLHAEAAVELCSKECIIWLSERYDKLKELGMTVRTQDLAIDGSILAKNGYTEGERIGWTLRVLMESVRAGKVANEREALLRMAGRLLESSEITIHPKQL